MYKNPKVCFLTNSQIGWKKTSRRVPSQIQKLKNKRAECFLFQDIYDISRVYYDVFRKGSSWTERHRSNFQSLVVCQMWFPVGFSCHWKVGGGDLIIQRPLTHPTSLHVFDVNFSCFFLPGQTPVLGRQVSLWIAQCSNHSHHVNLLPGLRRPVNLYWHQS